MKLSIILPVYNSHDTIKKCILSILNQKFDDFELIIIDDGSTDDSYYKCIEMAEKDKRIRVFKKKNGGASSARNYGISKSNGEYVTFIDADDYLLSDYYSEIYHKCDGEDMIYTHYIIEEDHNEKYIKNVNLYNLSKNPHDFTLLYKKSEGYMNGKYYMDNSISVYIWRIWVKKSFLTDNDIYFKEDLRYSEDRIFMMDCLIKKPKILICDNIFGYVHVVNHQKQTLSNLRDKCEYKSWMYEHQISLYNYENDLLNRNIFLSKKDKKNINMIRANSMRISLFLNEFKYNKLNAQKNYKNYMKNPYIKWAYNLDNLIYCVRNNNYVEVIKFLLVKGKLYFFANKIY